MASVGNSCFGSVFIAPSRPSSSKNTMEEYNTAMKKMMRNPYEYHHDLDPYLYSNDRHNIIFLSLRNGLPKAVSSLEWAISKGKVKVCVHCPAGLGRAPAVAVAYIYWFLGMNLTNCSKLIATVTVHMMLLLPTSKRPCRPSKRAIRGATYDLTKKDPWKEPLENLPEYAFEDIADWEGNLIRDRVCSLRGT
ncbi:unnamed protein product [Malus baccata var. baccata]